MNSNFETTPFARNRPVSRRSLLQLVGAVSLGAMALINAAPASAQDMSNGASNFYVSDRVTVEKVSFKTHYQTRVVGNLFIPSNLDRSRKHPAIIVGHPMGAVKEQSANLYATKMAEQGFIALSIDLPFWGESEGQARNAVAPDYYAEAFSAGVDFSVRRRWSTASGSARSGFAEAAASSSVRPRSTRGLKAIATVSMYDMGGAARNALRKSSTVEQRKAIIAEAAEQRYTEFAGGEARL